MFSHYDLFEEKILTLGKDYTEQQAKRLCEWVVEFMDQDDWIECQSVMRHEGIDCFLLTQRIAECGVFNNEKF